MYRVNRFETNEENGRKCKDPNLKCALAEKFEVFVVDHHSFVDFWRSKITFRVFQEEEEFVEDLGSFVREMATEVIVERREVRIQREQVRVT